MKYDTATPYIASFVILRDGNKVAFVLREHTQWMNGYYGLPAGKVEKNEAFSAAAIREAKEEAGVNVKPSDLKHILTVHRHEPSNFASEWVDVYFEAAKWTGTPFNAEPDKHSEIAWLDPTKLPSNTVPAVHFAFQQIQAGQAYSEYGWEK